MILKLIENFIKNSRSCIDLLLKELHNIEKKRDDVTLFVVDGNKRKSIQFDGKHLFLRASTEYANPQLTLEEIQGIIAARLLEVCCNYFEDRNISDITLNQSDLVEMSEILTMPPQGKVISFLLNTDDVEPDRYSINPLRDSILKSGQSSFPAASLITDELKIDYNFVAKYDGSLISRNEVDLIESHLKEGSNRYVDFVDAVKYDMLKKMSQVFGIDLCIPALRMPLELLKNEKPGGMLHFIVEDSHRDYDTIKTIYELMGRNIGKRKSLLLTVPHSPKGFGSKRAARGNLVFKQDAFENMKVKYSMTPLYPNMVDYTDFSVAKADDEMLVDAKKIINYDYSQTPSSPQFALYAVLSPEDAAIWHGIGKFAGVEVVKSYVSIRSACLKKRIFKGSCQSNRVPLQFNLVPEKMWRHPKYANIDASIGCIQDFEDLTERDTGIAPLFVKERLNTYLEERKQTED
jgi:hypothetical protein